MTWLCGVAGIARHLVQNAEWRMKPAEEAKRPLPRMSLLAMTLLQVGGHFMPSTAQLRYMALIFFYSFHSLPVFAQRTYVIQNWPEDIGSLPCDAWKREPNGVWTQIATIVVASRGVRIKRNPFGLGAAESTMLDKKCGVGS